MFFSEEVNSFALVLILQHSSPEPFFSCVRSAICALAGRPLQMHVIDAFASRVNQAEYELVSHEWA